MEHIIVRESFNETTTKYNISGKMVAITEKEIQRKLKAPMDAKHPSDPGYPACPDCGGKITRDGIPYDGRGIRKCQKCGSVFRDLLYS